MDAQKFMVVITSVHKTLLALFIIHVVFFNQPTLGYGSDIDVSGVFVDDKGGVAIVNDTLVKKGDVVAGASVVRIVPKGVVFARDGKEFLQKLRDPNPVASTIANTSTQKQGSSVNPSSSGQVTSNTPVKTLYGMPINKFFPDKETLKNQMQDSVPANTSIYSPGGAQQVMQNASDIKAKIENRQKELEQRLKEAEGE